MKFKNWLNIKEASPAKVLDRRLVYGPTGRFDMEPPGPLSRGVSGFLTGVGQATVNQMYRGGIGMPQTSGVIDFGQLKNSFGKIKLTASHPMLGTEKQTVEAMKAQIAADPEMQTYFQQRGIDINHAYVDRQIRPVVDKNGNLIVSLEFTRRMRHAEPGTIKLGDESTPITGPEETK